MEGPRVSGLASGSGQWFSRNSNGDHTSMWASKPRSFKYKHVIQISLGPSFCERQGTQLMNTLLLSKCCLRERGKDQRKASANRGRSCLLMGAGTAVLRFINLPLKCVLVTLKIGTSS